VESKRVVLDIVSIGGRKKNDDYPSLPGKRGEKEKTGRGGELF